MRDWEGELEGGGPEREGKPKKKARFWMGLLAFAVFAALAAAVSGPRIIRSIRDSGVIELLRERGEAGEAPARTARLCFVLRQGGEFLFKSEEAVLPPAPTAAHAAVEALLKGPSKQSGLQTLIPKGTRLVGLTVRGGRAFVDLSRKFASEPAAAGLAAKQIALTLKNVVPNLLETTILVEGKIFGDGGR